MAVKRRRKRAYGSGQVVPPKVAGGTWTIRVRINGKRVREGGLPNRETAEKVLAKYLANDVATRYALERPEELEEKIAIHAERFLERRKKTHRTPAEDKTRWNKHLGPFFGHLLPSQADRPLIRRFITAKLEEGLNPATVRILVSLLSSLFESLIEDDARLVNPAKGLPKSIAKLVKPTHDPSTTPFIEKLDDVGRIFRDLPEPLNIAFALGAMAGLRTSEAAGLRWRSIDLSARRIHVREQAGKRKGEDTVRLKDSDARVAPILDGLLPILKAWKVKTGGEGDERVVPPMRIDGRKLSKQSRGKYLQATLERFGLQRDGLGWYEATRHTFASQWVMNGGSIEKLKEILGHYSVVMTERYAHLRVDLFTEKDLGTIPLKLSLDHASVARLRPRTQRNEAVEP